MKKRVVLMFAIISLYSCNKEFYEKEIPQVSNPVSFEKENGILSFNSVNTFKDFMETYEQRQDEIIDYYKEGFIPLEPSNKVDQVTFSNLILSKKEILSRDNKSLFPIQEHRINDDNYDAEDDEIIVNDKFASLLNAKGEIIVGDSIYRFTKYGRFSSLISKKNELDSYVSNLTSDYQTSEGTIFVTKNIQRFIPNRDEFKKYEIQEVQDISQNNNNTEVKSLKTAPFWVPSTEEDTKHYNTCHNNRSHWIDRIFGVSYDCEYRFTSKRKLRTTFAVENYGFWMEVYGQAKFKQKTWFGWFSSRDAEHIYMRINHAYLEFETKELTLSDKNVRDGVKYVKQVFNWSNKSNNNNSTSSILNALNTPKQKRTFFVRARDFINNGLIMAQEALSTTELSVDFENFFNEKEYNVAVISILDKKKGISNMDIMKTAFNQLKQRGELLNEKPTGIFLMEHDVETERSKSTSYAVFNEFYLRSGQAILQNQFKIPRKTTIKNLVFGYSNNNIATGFENHRNYQGSSTFTYEKVKKLDINMETGAKFDGRWAGSKITIVYNN